MASCKCPSVLWIIRLAIIGNDIGVSMRISVLLLALLSGNSATFAQSLDSEPNDFERIAADNLRLQQQLDDLELQVQELRRTIEQPAAATAPEPLLENLAWRKGEYEIVPYGIGWFNMAWDSSRTANGEFTLYVESEDLQGEPAFSVNARATRFGLNITGPEIWGAESAGRVELDFFGQALVENRASVLLRHAYGEFRTDHWRIVAGQTFDVISPLNPNILNYTLGYAAGNTGYRRAQFRGELFLPVVGEDQLTLQGSLNQTIVADFAADPIAGGEDSAWPTIMGRVAYRAWEDGPEIGISGHVGEEGIDFIAAPAVDDARFESWSANADFQFPITDWFGFQGEFFIGQALSTFQGGINQAIDPVLRSGIRSLGGWAEARCHLTDRIHSHAGFGIDDPFNDDLSDGRRSQNHFYYANTHFHVTELFTIGMEVSWWETRYVGLADGSAVRLESVMQYRF